MSDYVVEALGLIVRVDPDALKAVVFVGAENNGVFTPLGTGFLSAVKHGNANAPIVVTANHVLDDHDGPTLWVRLMKRDGTPGTLPIIKNDRFVHDDPSNDMAVLPLNADPTIYDIKAIPSDRSAYERYKTNMGAPDVGDTVSTIGLYTTHHGTARNAPVVRTGNIGALPAEPVITEYGYVSAYLVETRSIAGLSGSPVYLNPPMIKVVGKAIHSLPKPSNFPIGMMLGYHLVKSKEDQIQVPQFQTAAPSERQKPSIDERNTGFGVVVPIERFYDIVEGAAFQEALERGKAELVKKSGYRKASATITDPAPDDANPNQKEDFTALLAAAARKPRSDG